MNSYVPLSDFTLSNGGLLGEIRMLGQPSVFSQFTASLRMRRSLRSIAKLFFVN